MCILEKITFDKSVAYKSLPKKKKGKLNFDSMKKNWVVKFLFAVNIQLVAHVIFVNKL